MKFPGGPSPGQGINPLTGGCTSQFSLRNGPNSKEKNIQYGIIFHQEEHPA